MQTAPDIAVLIIVPDNDKNGKPVLSAERRITPSWSIGQLKSKLEPVTGIPSSSQKLRCRKLDGSWTSLDDEHSQVGDARWSLRKGSEIEVLDTRPPGARQDFNDLSSVEKYQMPESQYEQLDDSVLAWKRRQKLGRFDPRAKSAEEVVKERRQKDEHEIKTKGIGIGDRCRLGSDDGRRGVVKHIGEIVGLGGEKEAGCVWIGIELDEPVGRNDGSVRIEVGGGAQPEVKRVFEAKDKCGVFARPEKVEIGDWPPLDDLEIDEDMEEI